MGPEIGTCIGIDASVVWMSSSNSRKDNQKSSRHIRRRLDSCRHAREMGVITVDYIKSERNLADPFTKGLAQKPIQAACMRMGLVPC